MGTYLMETICGVPMPRSLRITGYSWSIAGNWLPLSQRNLTNISWLNMPITLVDPVLQIKIRWTPLPNISIAFDISSDSDSVTRGDFFARVVTSRSGIGSCFLVFSANWLYAWTWFSSGSASPTTTCRYALRSLKSKVSEAALLTSQPIAQLLYDNDDNRAHRALTWRCCFLVLG